MKKKLFILFLSAVMALSMSACGTSDDDPAQSGNGNPPEITETDPDYLELAEYYVFELEGAEYSLPCKLSEFTDNGWYIDPEDMDSSVDPDEGHSIYVFPDNNMDTAAFMLRCNNTSTETKNASECDVVSITLFGHMSCHSLTLKKAGVRIDISSKEAALQSAMDLKAAYGTNENILSDMSSDDLLYDIWRLRYMFNLPNLHWDWEHTSIQIPLVEDSDSQMAFELAFAGLYE